jgi:ATPase subunit of ABC transporter with duplicated ATPase domains
MGSSTGAVNYYNLGTAAPTIQSMIDAEARRAHTEAQDALAQNALAQRARAQRSQAQRAHTQSNKAQKAKTLAQSKARAKDAQRVKALAKAQKEADRTIKRVGQLKEPNTKQAGKTKQTNKTKPATQTDEKPASGVSVFAILGTLFVSVLMVFVVLAQINFNETAAESVRLNVLIGELTERQRELELSFENAVDIREVERFARDELGMSRPDARQMTVIEAAPRDIALVLDNKEDRGLEGFGAFLRSLTDYFRRG